MKKAIFICIILFALASCSKDEENTRTMINKSIDISDFTCYVGSESGAKEIVFNNLRKQTLLNTYFGSNYQPELYAKYSFQFQGNKLTYIFPNDKDIIMKSVNDFTFSNDSLFILRQGGTQRTFVARGSSPTGLYRVYCVGFYASASVKRNQIASDTRLLAAGDLLAAIGYKSLNEMKSVSDTIAWCNVKYTFE